MENNEFLNESDDNGANFRSFEENTIEPYAAKIEEIEIKTDSKIAEANLKREQTINSVFEGDIKDMTIPIIEENKTAQIEVENISIPEENDLIDINNDAKIVDEDIKKLLSDYNNDTRSVQTQETKIDQKIDTEAPKAKIEIIPEVTKIDEVKKVEKEKQDIDISRKSLNENNITEKSSIARKESDVKKPEVTPKIAETSNKSLDTEAKRLQRQEKIKHDDIVIELDKNKEIETKIESENVKLSFKKPEPVKIQKPIETGEIQKPIETKKVEIPNNNEPKNLQTHIRPKSVFNNEIQKSSDNVSFLTPTLSDHVQNFGTLHGMIKIEKADSRAKIKVKIIEAVNLKPLIPGTSIISYVVCQAKSMSEKIFKKKTPIVNDCSAPVWGETFEFYYNSHDLHKLVIFLLVKKPTEKARLKSLLKKDKYDKLIYGSVRIGAAKYFTESEISIWKKLEENLNKNCTEWIEFKNPLNRLESAELGISASFSSLTNSPNESPQYSSQNIDTVNTRSADKIPEKIDREKEGRNRSESNRSNKVFERNDSLHESYSGNLGDSFQSNLQENSTENLQKADSNILSEGKSDKKHQDDDTVSFISLSSHYFAESHISGSLMINFKYNPSDRLLSVFIVRAEEYAASQKSSTKIFIKCKIIPKIGNNDKKTSSKFKDTGIVDFKLNYQFNLDPIQSNDTYFICKLYRSETIISKKFIGQIMVPASYILSKTPEELSKGFSDSYQLSPKIPYAKYGFKGNITLSTRCDPTSPDGRIGNLEVRVLKANNLSFNNKTDHLDTYVICSLLPRTDKKSRNKSGVIKNSADPEYKFCCTFQNVDMSDLKEHKCLEVTIWTNKSKFVGGTRIGSHHTDYFNENYQDSSKNEQDLWQNMLSHVREWVFGTIPLRYCMLSQNIFKNLTDNVEKLSLMFASKGRVLEFDIKYSTLGKRCFVINLKHVEGISTQNRTIFCKILSASGGVVTKSFTQYLESANERVWNRSIEVGFSEPIETASLEFRIKSHKTSKDIEEHDGTVFGRVLLSKAISTNEWNLPTQDEIDFFNKVIKNPNVSFPARLNINDFTKPKKINKYVHFICIFIFLPLIVIIDVHKILNLRFFYFMTRYF